MVKEKLWPFYDESINSSVIEITHADNLGAVDQHPSVEELEQSFIKKLNSTGYASFYNSGTSAYCAALFALDLEEESEVIVPSITFRGTITPLIQFGLRPVFVNCNNDGSISTLAIADAIGNRTKAIVVNHQWGKPNDILNIRALADKYGVALIEDCSHAHGGCINGIPLGTIGDISFFSCGTTKLVSGGLGGILYTKHREIFERSLLFGIAKHRIAEEITTSSPMLSIGKLGMGVNLRGHPLAAVLALHHLQKIDEITAIKNRNIEQLDALIRSLQLELEPLQRPAFWTHGTWYKRPLFASTPTYAKKFIQEGKKEVCGCKHPIRTWGSSYELRCNVMNLNSEVPVFILIRLISQSLHLIKSCFLTHEICTRLILHGTLWKFL